MQVKQEGINPVWEAAADMADILEDNMAFMHGVPHVSQAGMDQLSAYFTAVDYELRGPVYSAFLTTINSRGIDYSPEMFGGNA